MHIQRTELGRNVLTDLGYFTNCQIATYSHLVTKKSASKYDISRHRELCELMIRSCETHKLVFDELKYIQNRFEEARASDKTYVVASNVAA